MGETCVPASQDMPMCERKGVLEKLEGMVNQLERMQKTAPQIPKVLIRSEVCKCAKDGREKASPKSVEVGVGEGGVAKQVQGGGPASPGGGVAKQVQGGGPGGHGGGVTKQVEAGSPANSGAGSGVTKQAEDGDSASPGRMMNKQKQGGATGGKSSDKPKQTEAEKESCPRKKQAAGADDEPKVPGVPPPGPHPLLPVPRPQSFELRGSRMILGCDCLRRNGMQHDCQRTDCQGKTECLHFPAPVCIPSGLAPPVIVPSRIYSVEEPDCGPKKPKEKTKKQMDQRRILLNYAKAQFQSNPPRPQKPVPCRFHVRGKYYIRPLRRVTCTQTDNSSIQVS